LEKNVRGMPIMNAAFENSQKAKKGLKIDEKP
jgi:hypothetical protein